MCACARYVVCVRMRTETTNIYLHHSLSLRPGLLELMFSNEAGSQQTIVISTSAASLWCWGYRLAWDHTQFAMWGAGIQTHIFMLVHQALLTMEPSPQPKHSAASFTSLHWFHEAIFTQACFHKIYVCMFPTSTALPPPICSL